MKLIKTLLTSIILLVSITAWAQGTPKQVSVFIPTIQQEATSIWRTINSIDFFEKQGYTVNLPQDRLIDSLIQKAKQKTFSQLDYAPIYELLALKVYKAGDYTLALQKVQTQQPLLNTMLKRLDSLRKTWNWDFVMFDSYAVVFTLYGSGGSYDPSSGSITLLTTSQGSFKNYRNPANTIIHEIVHLGIEASIVQTFNIPHLVKERVVDQIVYLLFKDLLPEYAIQEMGDPDLAELLKQPDDIINLNSILGAYKR